MDFNLASLLIGLVLLSVFSPGCIKYFKGVLKRVNDAKLEKLGREIMSQKEPAWTLKEGDRVLLIDEGVNGRISTKSNGSGPVVYHGITDEGKRFSCRRNELFKLETGGTDPYANIYNYPDTE